jgi:glyoxylase-like metal-dependent hydrolase (beta-lactamase superfamily II)
MLREGLVPAPTRRQLLQAGSAAALTLAIPRGPLRAQGEATAQPLGSNLFIVSAGGVNAVAQSGKGGALLVDGGSAATSRALLDIIAALPGGGPVHTLFNSHWHPEQTGSNLELGEAGATIIAQENTRLWLTTDIVYPWDDSQRFNPLPKIAQPNDSFYDGGELASGVRFGYLRHAAHTDGDLYVYFPGDNVLAVGDAVSGEGWPFVDWWTGGWIGGVVGTLELILSLMNDDTRVVPARGPVLGITDIQDQFRMYNEIYTRLQTMLNNGFGPDDVIEARPTEEFDTMMGPSEFFVRRAFESLWAYLSPDA